MKTTTLNVHEETHKWARFHHKAGATMVHDENNRPIKAIYDSPYIQWAGQFGPSGDVEVPDMDYYNSLIDPAEIEKAVDELSPFLKGEK